MTEAVSGPIESPCNKICTIDPESRLCIGCFRSLDEIAAWGRMTTAERQAVLATLTSRAARLGRAAPAPKNRTSGRN